MKPALIPFLLVYLAGWALYAQESIRRGRRPAVAIARGIFWPAVAWRDFWP